MDLCDELRDTKLVDLGVRLEDKLDESGNPLIKLSDREQLLAEREAKLQAKKAAEEKKRLAAEKKAKEEAEKVSFTHFKNWEIQLFCHYIYWNEQNVHRKSHLFSSGLL